MSRVLVTGASGFIGRRAVAMLSERGHEVHAVARAAGPARAGVTWHSGDLLQPGAPAVVARAAKADRLLHFAWYAVPGLFWAAAENDRWVEASLRLLSEFAATGGERAVMAGTCAEYRWDDDPLNERTSAVEPSSRYGRCKDTTRRRAADLAAHNGVSFAWGRIFFLYGPGEHPSRLVASVARGLVRGGRVSTTEGSQVRDFLHVDDVAAAFVQLVERDVEGPVNIASGQACRVRDVITLLAEAAGSLDRVDFGGVPMRPDEPARITGDPGRLRDEVGFRPRISLSDGLTATVEWWRERVARELDPDRSGSRLRAHAD